MLEGTDQSEWTCKHKKKVGVVNVSLMSVFKVQFVGFSGSQWQERTLEFLHVLFSIYPAVVMSCKLPH